MLGLGFRVEGLRVRGVEYTDLGFKHEVGGFWVRV